MEITNTIIKTNKISRRLTFAVCSDLHNREFRDVTAALRETRPDAILIPGDLMNNLDRANSLSRSRIGMAFLRECVKIAPTFYTLGNHEIKIKDINRRAIEKTGAHLLLADAVRFGEVSIGSVNNYSRGSRWKKTLKPDMRGLERLERMRGFRILMSHHPEHYPEYLADRDVDLVISGHAHGGQWRFFGRGVFAPGQGLFPKYTSGLYDGKLYVSRGLTNTASPVPRINNPCELALIHLEKE